MINLLALGSVCQTKDCSFLRIVTSMHWRLEDIDGDLERTFLRLALTELISLQSFYPVLSVCSFFWNPILLRLSLVQGASELSEMKNSFPLVG